MFLRWYYRENRWVNLPKASAQGLLSEQGGDITTGAADELWRDRGFISNAIGVATFRLPVVFMKKFPKELTYEECKDE